MVNPKTYDVKTLHLMMIPSIAIVFLFRYIPIVGIVIAFQNFKPAKGFLGSQQEWVGLENFRYLFMMPDTLRVIRNTIIALCKIITGLVVPIIISLLINEVKSTKFKRVIQTSIYLPHFISWVIMGGILVDILSSRGIVNNILGIFGIEPVVFLADKTLFPIVIVATHIWKEFGYGTIIYHVYRGFNTYLP